MTNESTQLLSSNNSNSSADGCCDGTSKSGFSSRLRDMLMGAIVTAVVAAMVVKHVDHNNNNARFGVKQPVPSSSSSSSSSHSNQPEKEVHDKSRLRPPSSIQQEINMPVPIDAKYEKFQAFGFQIYTGGASAILPVPNSTTSSDQQRRPKLKNNPECEGRLRTLGHFDEDLEDVPDALPITFWQCYLGLEDPLEDALRRVEIMADAVERAHSLSDRDAKTLKVFNAPEFFFRGQEGAYVFDYNEPNVGSRGESCTAVCQLLQGLEKLVAQEKYKDWIFLFGTIIVAEGNLPADYDGGRWQAGDYLFYNFAPVYKGYDPKVTDHKGKRYIVPKRFMSQFDFLTTPESYNGSIAQELEDMRQDEVQTIRGERSDYPHDKHNADLFIPVTPKHDKKGMPLLENPYSYVPYQLYYDKDMWKKFGGELEALDYTMLEHHWLILDNVTFSIEICLDHLTPSAVALRTAQVDNIKESPLRIPRNIDRWDPATEKYVGDIEYVKIPRAQAQLSLVSSMGMEADPEALALADGGTLILQDGEHQGSGFMTTEHQCDTGFPVPKFNGGSQSITRASNFGQTTYSYYDYTVNEPLQSSLVYEDEDSFRKAADGVFTTATFKPTIYAYAPSDLAKVSLD